MKYYWITPEIAGGFGEGNDYDVSRTPSLIGTLYYEFNDWAGDDIVTEAGFWLVTDRLATALVASELTGWKFGDVVVTFGDYWQQPNSEEFPQWRRLISVGVPLKDDFGVRNKTDLAVSDRAIAFLRQFTLNHAKLYPVSEYPDGEPNQVMEILEQMRKRREASE